jgi:hypothetical protein
MECLTFCFVIKKLAKLIYEAPYKTVTYVSGTFVTLDSGPYTPQGGRVREGVMSLHLLRLYYFLSEGTCGNRAIASKVHGWRLE